MATYNKRGFKTPKPKELTDDNTTDFSEDTNSTTAEVFGTLTQKANKVEEWVAKNQNILLSVLGAVALVTVGYFLYQKYIVDPKEDEAVTEMLLAQDLFAKGLNDDTKKDSLFTLALNGSDGKFGFVKIAENYSGTDAANIANYHIGIIYLHQGKNKEAIEFLDKFKSKDVMLSALAKGAIGDAFAQRNQANEALDYYEQAIKISKNNITSPRFLYKAGQTAYELGQNQVANKYFQELKDNYQSSSEARNVDALIELTQ